MRSDRREALSQEDLSKICSIVHPDLAKCLLRAPGQYRTVLRPDYERKAYSRPAAEALRAIWQIVVKSGKQVEDLYEFIVDHNVLAKTIPTEILPLLEEDRFVFRLWGGSLAQHMNYTTTYLSSYRPESPDGDAGLNGKSPIRWLTEDCTHGALLVFARDVMYIIPIDLPSREILPCLRPQGPLQRAWRRFKTFMGG